MTHRLGLTTAVAAAACLAAGIPAATASPAAPSGPMVSKAPESAFTAAGAAADPVACARPAPDGRVSTTLHCYAPNDIRAHYGLSPLTPGTTDYLARDKRFFSVNHGAWHGATRTPASLGRRTI